MAGLRRGALPGIAAVCAAVALVADAAAAAPLGAPQIRPSTRADHVARPPFAKEWWTLRLLDPRSAQRIVLTLQRHGQDRVDPTCCVGAFVRHYSGDPYDDDGIGAFFDGWPEATAKRARVAGENDDGVRGVVTFRLGRHRSRATVDSAVAKADIGIRHRRFGPAAVRFRLGWGQVGSYRKTRLNWASLIARGVARGTFEAQGRTVRVRGWRASYEHVWGDFAEADSAWDHWDDWVVHRRTTTWMLYGLNRSDTMTGAGARDAQWLGVLARVGPRGLRMCRPEIHRLHWDLYTSLYASNDRLSAECGGMRALFRFARRGDFNAYATEFHGPGLVNGHGDGWMLQRWTSD